jgi:hypothetical protein
MVIKRTFGSARARTGSTHTVEKGRGHSMSGLGQHVFTWRVGEGEIRTDSFNLDQWQSPPLFEPGSFLEVVPARGSSGLTFPRHEATYYAKTLTRLLESVATALERFPTTPESLLSIIDDWEAESFVTGGAAHLNHVLLITPGAISEFECCHHELWQQVLVSGPGETLQIAIERVVFATRAVETHITWVLNGVCEQVQALTAWWSHDEELSSRLHQLQERVEKLREAVEQDESLLPSWRTLLPRCASSTDRGRLPSAYGEYELARALLPTKTAPLAAFLDDLCGCALHDERHEVERLQSAVLPAVGPWVSRTDWGPGGGYEIRVLIGGFASEAQASDHGDHRRLLRIGEHLVLCSAGRNPVLLRDHNVSVFRLRDSATLMLGDEDFERVIGPLRDLLSIPELARSSYGKREFGARLA